MWVKWRRPESGTSERMSIRNLFFLLTLMLALLLGALGLWLVADSHTKVLAVDWLQKSNRLVDTSQQASAELAVERGLTARLLASLDAPDDGLWLRVQVQRRAVDRQHEQLRRLLDELVELSPGHPLAQYQQRLAQMLSTLQSRREAVAAAVTGQRPALQSSQWISDSSRMIEVLHSLAGVSMLPLEDNIYSYASQPIIKDVLFTMGEYLGRERALLVVVLSRRSPLTLAEQRQLDEHRSVVEQARRRTEAILDQLQGQQGLQQVRLHFEREMLVYDQLRADILASSRREEAYQVTAEQWFTQATLAIQSVHQMSRSLGRQFEENVEQLRRNAVWARQLVLLAFIALFALFSLAVHLLRKRILQPLQRLTLAANEIAGGQLDHPLAALQDDEVGRLGQAFERMREQLLADCARRAVQGRELHKLHTAIEQSVAAMLITDRHGIIEYINPQFAKVTGYREDELIGHKAGVWRSGETASSNYQDLWNTIRGGKVWMGELLNKRKNGELYWALVSISPVCDEQGQITHYIDIHLDISEHKRIAERLDFVSYYDQTTNLPNRQLLARRFTQASQQTGELHPALAMVSLSIGRLKTINDSLGWAVGDQVLREVGRRLKNCVKAQDTVSHQEGGQFSVLLCQVRDAEDALQRATRMVDALSRPFLLQQHQLQLTPKAGISLLQGATGGFEVLLKNADIALHHAEQSPVERVRLYCNEMDISAQQRLALESALRQALSVGGLELHYQPKVEIASGRIHAVEALARWRDVRTGQYVSPQVFIPVAEESGLIHALGDWVLLEACQQSRRWQEQGLPALTIAVNISVDQLKQPGFPERVAEVLQLTGLPAHCLEFELTESIFMENPEQALGVLARLKQMGLKLSIDDFGTGYSSLAYLSRLPVDYLKIDRSFVEHVTTDLRAAAIATSVIALGHRMGLRVVAEGVESQAQLFYLAQHDCDEMQGYHFSRPLPAQGVLELLRGYQAQALVAATATLPR